MSRAATTGQLSKAHEKLIRSLHRSKGRKDSGCFLVEGLRAVSELTDAVKAVEFLFGSETLLAELPPSLRACNRYVSSSRSVHLFSTHTPQQIGAVVRIPEEPPVARLIQDSRPIVYLDGISDPGNVGTLVRTAIWFGIHNIVLGPGSASPWNPKSVRASAGTMWKAHIVVRDVREELLAAGRHVFFLDADAEATIGQSRLDTRGIYVLGSEAHGVNVAWRKAGRGLALRSHGAGESLNAAVAGSILFWELSKSLQAA